MQRPDPRARHAIEIHTSDATDSIAEFNSDPQPTVVFFRRQHFDHSIVQRVRRRHERQRLSEALLASSAQGQIALDGEGRIRFTNPAAARMLGYTTGELLGRPLSTLFEAPPLTGDRPPTSATFRGRDGRRLDVLYTYRPLTGGQALAGAVVSFVEAAATNGLINQEAARRSEVLKDQILNALSHELRTPISVIAGFASIMQEEMAGPMTSQQHEYLGHIEEETLRLLSLVNDLIDMSQIQSGKLILCLRPLDLAELVKDVLAMVQPLTAKKGQKLEDEVPAHLPPVQADDSRLSQVLTHLIVNASKFSAEGSRIRVHAAQVEGGLVRCEVENSGGGLTDDDVPRLFQRFSQLDMSSTRRFGGTGVGLYICKALIEAHGGQVGVTLDPGVTSTFWFTLPVARVS